jgi:hypothetical protein
MQFCRLVLIALCSISFANAQIISVGIIGGAPFNDVVTSGFPSAAIQATPQSTNFTAGASLQLNLPARFRVEGDFLYRPYDLRLVSSFIGPVGGQTTTSITGSQFRIPLLFQYRFNTGLVKPFVEAGISVDHLNHISATSTSVLFLTGNSATFPGGIPLSGSGQLIQQTHAGIVAGGGVDIKIPFVRLSAEARFTRQGEYFRDVSNLNEAEFLLGIHF